MEPLPLFVQEQPRDGQHKPLDLTRTPNGRNLLVVVVRDCITQSICHLAGLDLSAPFPIFGAQANNQLADGHLRLPVPVGEDITGGLKDSGPRTDLLPVSARLQDSVPDLVLPLRGGSAPADPPGCKT
jgi:hypothetical protein